MIFFFSSSRETRASPECGDRHARPVSPRPRNTDCSSLSRADPFPSRPVLLRPDIGLPNSVRVVQLLLLPQKWGRALALGCLPQHKVEITIQRWTSIGSVNATQLTAGGNGNAKRTRALWNAGVRQAHEGHDDSCSGSH